MLRAVLDANVIISALIQPKGASGRIVASLLEDGSFELVVSPAILAEIRRSLTYPKVRKYVKLTDEELDLSIAALACKSKKLLDRGELERQIGRLLERISRAAGRYTIVIGEDKASGAGVKLQWSKRSEWDDWAKLSEGTYILRSNIHDWTDEELWKTYIQLSEAEAAFRIHKSDLCIRPIGHHKQERIKAHILICFLAYVLWKTLQKWQSRAGLGDSPRTILTELSRIHSADPPHLTSFHQLRLLL